MLRATSLIVAALTAPSAAWASDPADRAFLGSQMPGSLVAPQPIEALSEVKALCAAIAEVHLEGEDEVEPDEAARAAARAVYRVVVGPGDFALKWDQGDVVLDLRRPLRLFRDDLTLMVMASAESTFAFTPEVAEGLHSRVRAKQVALEVVFRLEGTESGVPACFVTAGGHGYRLRVEPLSYTLLAVDSKAELAQLRTPVWSQLHAWVAPGAASVRLDVVLLDGKLADLEGTQADLRTEALSACWKTMSASRNETGLLSLVAQVSKQSRLVDIEVEVDAVQAPPVVDCVLTALAAAPLTHTSGWAKLSIQVGVERETDREAPEAE